MKNFLRKYPLYLILLPVFFVLHGFLENFSFIGIKDAAILCLTYIFLTLNIALFSYFFFRNVTKAALITTLWMVFFFFFGAVHEFLRENISVRFFSRYGFLLPFMFLLLILIFIYLKKVKKPFYGTSLFLNVLFLVYILIDTTGVIIKALNPDESSGLSVYDFARNNKYSICDTCSKPNIYLLLMDEYSSSLSLKERHDYNNDLDSFLIDKGFRIQAKSRSNYNFTPFSMSSTLNMSFIEGIPNYRSITADDYAFCNKLVRDNELIKFLDAHGYDIVNYSVFDLAGHPAMVQQMFLPLKTKLITDRTLFSRMYRDIGWLMMNWYPFKWFKKTNILMHRSNNQKFFDLVKEAAKEEKKKPQFVYAHFYMPHSPYYYDKDGNEKDNPTIYSELHDRPITAYLDYVTYTNGRIREMVNAIMQDDPSGIIVLLSDHGNRKNAKPPMPVHIFQNLNAVYYPDRNYSSLYDSITNVNMFRVILNKNFNQQFQLLKDTSIFLEDKRPVDH